MSQQRHVSKEASFYEEGDALKAQLLARHRKGTLWQIMFASSLLLAIISLVALLYTIMNDSFGYVVVVNKVDPERLALGMVEEQLVGAPNTVDSEDDGLLVEGIASNINGIGFLGNAYYQQNQDSLKLLAVDGVTPNLETAVSGEYSLTRPLYLYTAASVLNRNSAANIFMNYALTHVSNEIMQVGYFPVEPETLSIAQYSWLALNPEIELAPGQWAAISPNNLSGHLSVAGSSTVSPVIVRLLDKFTADGYAGTVTHETVGSTAGLAAFCNGEADIALASRAIESQEFERCRANGRFPIGFHVGTDVLSVVANPDNTFLTAVSREELQTIFTTAETWQDVNPRWPNEPIQRYIPGAASGTLDFFSEVVYHTELADLSKDQLVRILAANISVGRGRALEREQRFYENALAFESPALWNEVCAVAPADRPSGCTASPRSQQEVYQLVLQEVVRPDVIAVYSLSDSLLKRGQIQQETAVLYPNGELVFRSWLTSDFIRNPQSSVPEYAGVRTAIFGSIWVIIVTLLFSFPIGVGAAIYLEEYAADNQVNRIIQTNINNLAGVPSIIYGMLGLAIFVRTLEAFTSGAAFGAVESTATANGRTILSAGLTLGLLILPLLIINGQEALRSVPNSLRQAGLALGATKWQTTWHHVLPAALPGILTGTILSISRALGETAPLVVVGASTFITVDPSNPFSKFTTLPIQIYQWTSRPQAEFRNIAAAAIMVLLIVLLSLNATAVYLRNRYSVRV